MPQKPLLKDNETPNNQETNEIPTFNDSIHVSPESSKFADNNPELPINDSLIDTINTDEELFDEVTHSIPNC